MKTSANVLTRLFRLVHDEMRNIDGLQPSEAFDEILKYLIFKMNDETNQYPVHSSRDRTSIGNLGSTSNVIKNRFNDYMRTHGPYIRDISQLKEIRLSDNCLNKVHDILGHISFTSLSCDVRSAAIRAFLQPTIRKGLGIFLTPEAIVKEIVDFFRISESQVVLDPACGSGTFLMAADRNTKEKGGSCKLLGIDKSPRMMLLAELNLWDRSDNPFEFKLCDTLRYEEYVDWLAKDSVDVIVTNPPFGVDVDEKNYDLSNFVTARTSRSGSTTRQSSELLFLEQCIRLLKPDGYLGIVLPRSVVTMFTESSGSSSLGMYAAVRGIITLPPETFASTGTMTNTVVLFIQKYGTELNRDSNINPVISRIRNVGFDATGRMREESELPGLGRAFKDAVFNGKADERITIGVSIKAHQSFTILRELVAGSFSHNGIRRKATRLADYVECVTTGVTPPRRSYLNADGLFLVKVGNLTGTGINWNPRNRNFVQLSTNTEKRYSKEHMNLQFGDILLTSSAHSPVYIAKKVDIVTSIPEWVGGKASYVGEVMLIRPDVAKIDPFSLLAYLRIPGVVTQIQQMIRGQTAHLHSRDVIDMPIYHKLLESNKQMTKMIDTIKKECSLNDQLNQVVWEKELIAENLSDQVCVT